MGAYSKKNVSCLTQEDSLAETPSAQDSLAEMAEQIFGVFFGVDTQTGRLAEQEGQERRDGLAQGVPASPENLQMWWRGTGYTTSPIAPLLLADQHCARGGWYRHRHVRRRATPAGLIKSKAIFPESRSAPQVGGESRGVQHV